MEFAGFFGLVFGLLFGLIAFVAQMRLFNINRLLVQIRDELLIARQERQVSRSDEKSPDA